MRDGIHRALGRDLWEEGITALRTCHRAPSHGLRASGGGVHRALGGDLRTNGRDLRAFRGGRELRANRHGDRTLRLDRRAERGVLRGEGGLAFIRGQWALSDHRRTVGRYSRALGQDIRLCALGHGSEIDRAHGDNLRTFGLLLRTLGLHHGIRAGGGHHRARGGFGRADRRIHSRRAQGRERRTLGLLVGALRGDSGAERRPCRACRELRDTGGDFRRALGGDLRAGCGCRADTWQGRTDGHYVGGALGSHSRALGGTLRAVGRLHRTDGNDGSALSGLFRALGYHPATESSRRHSGGGTSGRLDRAIGGDGGALGLGSKAVGQLDGTLGDRRLARGRANGGDDRHASRGLGRTSRLSNWTTSHGLRENRGLDHLVYLDHPENPARGRRLTGNLNKRHAFTGMVELLVVRNGNPAWRCRRIVEIFRVVIGILGRVEAELHGWRRCIINGKIECRIWSAIGLEPE